jgi:hypothetical protein
MILVLPFELILVSILESITTKRRKKGRRHMHLINKHYRAHYNMRARFDAPVHFDSNNTKITCRNLIRHMGAYAPATGKTF